MKRVGFYLLGYFELRLNDVWIETFRCNKMGALLAYLAMEADRPHLREALAELFWPDRSRGVARADLRQALLGIRRVIQEQELSTPLLEITPSTIQLNRINGYLADTDLFKEQFQANRGHAHENLETCSVCMNGLAAAADLYRGDFLDGMNFDEEPGFYDWVQFNRRYYFHQQLQALHHLTNYYQSLNQYDIAYQYALRQIKMEPVKESAHRQIMCLFASTGQRSAAIEQYKVCCQTLDDELGIEPEPETTALFERIKAGKSIKNEPLFS